MHAAPAATIWIDVEDVVDYFRYNPHPSGIQRVAIAIMRALHGAAAPVRFVRAAQPGPGVREIDFATIEAMLASPPEPIAESDLDDDLVLRSRLQRTILRLPPELRDPLFRAGVLQSQVLRNVRALIHRVRPPPPRRLRAFSDAPTAQGGEPGPGDLFVMLGAPWSVAGAAERLAALHAQGVRTALLIHDLIPVRRPEWYPPARVQRFHRWLDASLPHTDQVLTLSRFTADDVSEYARRYGTPLAAPPRPIPAGTSLLAPGTVPPGLPVMGSYVLFVSTLEARKNHALLVRVWHRLVAEILASGRDPATIPQLVFAGRVGLGVADLMQQLDNSRWLAGRVRLIREPSDAELRALYEGCRFTILPSLFEGWGLPLGESLALGKPCLAASGTALPEAGGDLCRYFDPEDAGDAHRAIAALLDDPEAVSAWQADIRRRFQPRDWSDAARVIADLSRRPVAVPA